MAQEDMANIVPPTIDPEVNVDILRRSLLEFDALGLVVSSSLETAYDGPKPEGALFVVGDPKDDEEDRVQQSQRFIVSERVQRHKEGALQM